jgi:excisionase family DNA binding protein
MKPTPAVPVLLTGDVARRCEVSPEAVRYWANTGRLPAIKTVGGRRLFLASDVDAWRARRAASVSRADARRAR